MAGGFLKGLVHGGLLGAVALAVLSLLAPLPAVEDRAVAPEGEVRGMAEPDEIRPEVIEPDMGAPDMPAPDAAPVADGAPTAAAGLPSGDPVGAVQDPSTVGLPVGSEFGRGGDIAPRLPAPQSATPRASGDPVAVPAPAAEPAPTALTGENTRPETLADDRMPAQALPREGGAAPGLTLPQTAPDAGAPRAASVPDQGSGQDAAPQIAPAAEDLDPPADAAEEHPGEPDAAALPAAPGLPSPVLDLSLPPDLTDLRRMERN